MVSCLSTRALAVEMMKASVKVKATTPLAWVTTRTRTKMTGNK